MKTSNKFYGVDGSTDNNSETDPDILDRVSALAPKPKKIKTMDKESLAFQKSVNESKPAFKQNTPDYTPAKKAPGIKIPAQKKRDFFKK